MKTAQPTAATTATSTLEYEIAVEFVREYFAILSQSPELLHQFYKDESTMLYLEEADRSGKTARGLNEIKEMIKQIGFSNSLITISALDCQRSVGDSLVIMVVGDLSAEAKFRRFSQTFVLAQQEQGFFIYNDICRFFIYDQAEMVAVKASEAKSPLIENAPQKIVAPVAVPPSSKQPEILSNSHLSAKQPNVITVTYQPGHKQTEVASNAVQPAQKQPEVASSASEPAQKNHQLSQEPSTSQTPSFNWANAHLKLIGQAATHSSVSLEKSLPASPKPVESRPAPTRPEADFPIERRGQKPHSSQNAHKNCLFLRLGDERIYADQIKKEFSKAGKIVDVHLKATYAVIEYDSEKTAEHAATLSYYHNGKLLSITSKKPTYSGDRSRARGNFPDSKGSNSFSTGPRRSPSSFSTSGQSLYERENGSASSIKSSK